MRASIHEKQSKAVFTLIELLVVIAIIAVLITMLLPALRKAKRVAERVVCQGNMKQMAVGAFAYAGDNEGLMPERTHSTYTLGCKITYKSKFVSFKTYAEQYLQIPIKYVGADIYGYPAAGENTVLRCPAAQRPDTSWHAWTYPWQNAHSSYAPWGFSDWGDPTKPPLKGVRIHKLAKGPQCKNYHDYEFIILGDMLLPPGHYSGYERYSHDFQGGNFAYVDGRVSWTPVKDTAYCYGPPVGTTMIFYRDTPYHIKSNASGDVAAGCCTVY